MKTGGAEVKTLILKEGRVFLSQGGEESDVTSLSLELVIAREFAVEVVVDQLIAAKGPVMAVARGTLARVVVVDGEPLLRLLPPRADVEGYVDCRPAPGEDALVHVR